MLITNSWGLLIFGLLPLGPVPPNLCPIKYSLPAVFQRGGSSGSHVGKAAQHGLDGGQPPKKPSGAGRTPASPPLL